MAATPLRSRSAKRLVLIMSPARHSAFRSRDWLRRRPHWGAKRRARRSVPHLPAVTALRTGGKRVLAQTLDTIETAAGSAELAELLDAAAVDAKAHVSGIAGPPGVGKSTLTHALVKRWRAS